MTATYDFLVSIKYTNQPTNQPHTILFFKPLMILVWCKHLKVAKLIYIGNYSSLVSDLNYKKTYFRSKRRKEKLSIVAILCVLERPQMENLNRYWSIRILIGFICLQFCVFMSRDCSNSKSLRIYLGNGCFVYCIASSGIFHEEKHIFTFERALQQVPRHFMTDWRTHQFKCPLCFHI